MKLGKKVFFIISIVLGYSISGFSQEKLTLSDALSQALKNNFSLNIFRDSAAISSNNNTAGNAGLLPQIGTQAGISGSNNNIHQSFSGRPDVQTDHAKSGNKSASVQASYVLFNGFKMFAAKKRLAELEFLGHNNLNIQIESLIANVMSSYYNIIKVIQNENVSKESIRINDERIKIAQTRFQVGAGNKIDLLQAKVDRNQSESSLMAQQISLDSAKIFLNQLIGRKADIEFEPADSNLTPSFLPSFPALLDSAVKSNATLKSAASASRIAEFSLKIVKADQFPVLVGNAAYVYNRSTNSAGFSLYNQSFGPQLGLNLNWNLFDGGNVKRRIRNAQLSQHAVQLQYQNIYANLLAQLTAQFKSYQNALTSLALEEQNVTVARENLNIALAKYRLGASTQIELMTAEQSLESSLNRRVLARYKAKIGETNLLRLSGAFVVHSSSKV